MSVFFGIFNRKQNLVSPEKVRLMAYSEIKSKDSEPLFYHNHSFLAAIIHEKFINESFFEKLPVLSEDKRYVIFFDGRIDNRDELKEKLHLADYDSISDSGLTLEWFIKRGADALVDLLGDFAFIVFDNVKKEITCARDFIGVKPLYYALTDEILIFSSTINGLLVSELISKEPDEQYIADCLAGIVSEKWRTYYKNIKRLEPATYLVIKAWEITSKKFWDFNTTSILELKNEKEYVTRLQFLLEDSIRCRLNTTLPVGAELSSGLDSSGIAAIASKILKEENKPLFTYTHTMPDEALGNIKPFHDEREQVASICKHLSFNNHFFINASKKLIIPSLQQNIIINGMTTQQRFQAFSDALYETAKEHHIGVLLSGFGGDELISFRGAGFYNELARKKWFSLLIHELKTRNNPKLIKLLKQLVFILMQVYMPKWGSGYKQLRGYRHYSEMKYANACINKEFEQKMKIKEKVKFIAHHSEPVFLKERQLWHISHRHVSQRLEYSGAVARHFGIEYRYPLLDRRIVEFGLSLPVNLIMKEGKGRYLYRKAIENMLPPEIVWKEKGRGATIPSVMWRMLKDKDSILQLIEEAEKRKVGSEYIDYQKLKYWFDKIIKGEETDDKPLYSSLFLNYLELILFLNSK